MDDLRRRWGPLVPGTSDLVDDLLDRWSEPHRRYHTVVHLRAVLDRIDLLDPAGAAGGAGQLARLGAWYHDAVYRPGGDDNEQRSARLASATLPAAGVAPADVDEVARLVLLTAGHRPVAGDAAGCLLCDADLGVLGQPAAAYLAYSAEVREEFAATDDAAWRRGRTAVLADLLARPTLFATPEGRRRWEEPARHNLRAELDRLG